MSTAWISTVPSTHRVRRPASIVMTILLAALVAGCATTGTYRAKAYPTVPRPTLDNQDHGAWAAYYNDQFAALGETVAPPPADYPNTAKKAYADAKTNWDERVAYGKQIEKQGSKSRQNMFLWGIGGGVALFVITLLVTGG